MLKDLMSLAATLLLRAKYLGFWILYLSCSVLHVLNHRFCDIPKHFVVSENHLSSSKNRSLDNTTPVHVFDLSSISSAGNDWMLSIKLK